MKKKESIEPHDCKRYVDTVWEWDYKSGGFVPRYDKCEKCGALIYEYPRCENNE